MRPSPRNPYMFQKWKAHEDDENARLVLQTGSYDDMIHLDGRGSEVGREDSEGEDNHHGDSIGFPIPPLFAYVAKLPWDVMEGAAVQKMITEAILLQTRSKLASMHSRGGHAQRMADGGGPLG